RATRDDVRRPERSAQPLDVFARIWRERRDFRRQVVHRIRLRFLRFRIEPDVLHIRLVALADDAQLSGGDLRTHERGFVSSHRAHEQSRAAICFDGDWRCGETVFLPVLEQFLPALRTTTIYLAAARELLERDFRIEVFVGEIAAELLLVLLDEL